MNRLLRRISTSLIICILIVACTLIVIAEDETGIKVYNSELVTNDLNATYIEGEVPVADGQDIVVVHGILTVARKTMPETGQPAQFRIKIPASELNKDGVTSLRVKATDGKTVKESLPARVEISYKAKEDQTIKTGSNEYQLTLPGLKETIDAETSSGSDVYYSSSNPDVVDVDENGNLVPIGKGEAEISVKTIGSNKYNGAEKSVDVKVDEIDAYSVTFHSSAAEGDETSQQIINLDSTEALKANEFVNGDHRFLGWATEDGGLVRYDDAQSVENLAAKGENTDLYAVWTGDGAVAAVAWAIDIANDNSFSYGKKPQTSSIGCYFCGTNQKKKPKGYEKTYVCLTFAAAAYAHGAEDPEVYYACSHAKMPLYENDNNFKKFSCWTKIGRCSNLSIDDLKPGDLVIQWSDHNDNNGHVWMYAGDNNVVDSEGIKDCWGPNSIAVRYGKAAAKLRSTARANSKSYVMRYTGVNAQ